MHGHFSFVKSKAVLLIYYPTPRGAKLLKMILPELFQIVLLAVGPYGHFSCVKYKAVLLIYYPAPRGHNS